ncbi:MAG: hypothetical protein WA771_14390 [Chthoniobacterales bacterium]
MKTKLALLSTAFAFVAFAASSAFAGDCSSSCSGKKGEKKDDTKESATLSIKL